MAAPTLKEQTITHLNSNGRTVSGLLATIEEVTPLYIAKHEQIRDASAISGKSIKPKEIGGATHNPAEAALKACISEAFPAASVVGTTLLTVELGEEATVMRLLLASIDKELSFLNWLNSNSARLIEQAKNIATHASKLAHTGSNTSVVNNDVLDTKSPYLSSVTAQSATNTSFFGSSSFIPLGRVLFGAFLYQGAKLSLYAALQRGNTEFLKATGLDGDLIEKLQAAVLAKPSLGERVPVIKWPLGDGKYVSMSPLPSIAVLDELATAHSDKALDARFVGRWVPTVQLKIGGSMPQNAGSFNLSNKGTYNLFSSRLSIPSQDSESTALRRLWTSRWLNNIGKSTVGKLEASLSKFDNQSKKAHMLVVAQGVVEQTMAFVVQAHYFLEAGLVPKKDAKKLGEHVKKIVEYNILYKPNDAELNRLVVGNMFKICVKAGCKSLTTDLEKRAIFVGALETALKTFVEQI